jgi:hypothetical protein
MGGRWGGRLGCYLEAQRRLKAGDPGLPSMIAGWLLLVNCIQILSLAIDLHLKQAAVGESALYGFTVE